MTTCSMQREMMMYSIILASIRESSRCDFVGCEGLDSFDSKPNSTSSCSKYGLQPRKLLLVCCIAASESRG
jgi:hypothetical protein